MSVHSDDPGPGRARRPGAILFDHESYISPFTWRYGSPAMRRTALVCCLLAAVACAPGGDEELGPLALEGKELYQNVCIACHNGDPNRDGALGPAIAGSSEELLLARVVRGEYPPDYLPKRPDSMSMPRFPQLEPQIPALTAYLAAVEEPSATP